MKRTIITKSGDLLKKGLESISNAGCAIREEIDHFTRKTAGKNGGFSMGELLIALGVIAALAVILIPTYKAVSPDKSETMHKKATFIVERLVNELVTDEYLYPTGGEYEGFGNTSGVTANGVNHAGNTKFCTLFTSRLNIKPGTEVNCAPGALTATSAEGIDWYVPISDFKNGPESLIADVNGAEGPNCTYSANCTKPDRFEYKVDAGVKVPVKEVVQNLPPTGNPPSHGGPTGNITPTETERKGLERYSISCQGAGGGAVEGATIFGQGDGKINGNYTLVALPKPGYRCSWFTHQVTVDNGPVTDCQITCTKDLEKPDKDGTDSLGPEPGDDDDDDDDDDKTYCLNVEVAGDSNKCTVSGAGCGKAPGLYTVTVSSSDPTKYTASWTSKKVAIIDKDVTETVNCSAIEQCYSIKVTGSDNCEITMPKGNCKSDPNKFLNGKYTISVKPKEGYTYQGKKSDDDPTNYEIEVNGKDATATIACTGISNKCVINLVGTGAASGGRYAELDLKGVVQKSAKLDKTNSFKAKWSELPCLEKYNIVLTKAANNENPTEKVEVTISPTLIDNLENSRDVAVNFNGLSIAIEVAGLTGSGGAATTFDGSTVTVKPTKTSGTTTVSGLKVVPSDKERPWKIEKVGGSGSFGPSPASGSGENSFTVTIDNAKDSTPGCVQAKYSDGSAASNKICFAKDDSLSKDIKVTLYPKDTAGKIDPSEIAKNCSNSGVAFYTNPGENIRSFSGSLESSYSATVKLDATLTLGQSSYVCSVPDPKGGSPLACTPKGVVVAGSRLSASTGLPTYKVTSSSLSPGSSEITGYYEWECAPDPCNPKNSYDIKIRESSPEEPSIAAGGPWYYSNPLASREGDLTVKGGTSFSITLIRPKWNTQGGALEPKEPYIKSFTVNGKAQDATENSIYKVTVCEPLNMNIEYGIRDIMDWNHNKVYVNYYLDGKKVKSDPVQEIIENYPFSLSVNDTLNGGKFKYYEITDGQFNPIKTGTSPNIAYSPVTSDLIVNVYYVSEQKDSKLIVYLTGGQTKWAGWSGEWELMLNSSSLGSGSYSNNASNTMTKEFTKAVKEGDTVSATINRIEYYPSSGGTYQCPSASASGKVSKAQSGDYVANLAFTCGGYENNVGKLIINQSVAVDPMTSQIPGFTGGEYSWSIPVIHQDSNKKYMFTGSRRVYGQNQGMLNISEEQEVPVGTYYVDVMSGTFEFRIDGSGAIRYTAANENGGGSPIVNASTPAKFYLTVQFHP